MKKTGKKVALFHRQYLAYSGGHGKVWDYFNHIKRSGLYEPKIFFTSDSVFDNNNPWLRSRDSITTRWEPEKADLLFLAGMDWQAMPVQWNKNAPIINLIQGIRHGDPDLPLYDYLKRPAIRICVSRPIADAILATGQVNGPVHVIPNGIKIPKKIQESPRRKKGDLLIGAWKNVSLGREIADQAQKMGYLVDLFTQPIARNDLLQKIKEARLAILLPLAAEGFYLPGLEAMALGTPVIMPDCTGNREYAVHEENCLIVEPENIISAIRYFDSPSERARIQSAGLKTAKRYTLDLEFERFLQVLKNIETVS